MGVLEVVSELLEQLATAHPRGEIVPVIELVVLVVLTVLTGIRGLAVRGDPLGRPREPLRRSLHPCLVELAGPRLDLGTPPRASGPQSPDVDLATSWRFEAHSPGEVAGVEVARGLM